MAQRQLERFERAGALVSSLRGRTRLYTWNPRYTFRRALRALLRKALDQLPSSERKRYFTERRRPHRASASPDLTARASSGASTRAVPAIVSAIRRQRGERPDRMH